MVWVVTRVQGVSGMRSSWVTPLAGEAYVTCNKACKALLLDRCFRAFPSSDLSILAAMLVASNSTSCSSSLQCCLLPIFVLALLAHKRCEGLLVIIRREQAGVAREASSVAYAVSAVGYACGVGMPVLSPGCDCADGYCWTAQGYLSVNYSATYYELAQRHPEVPRLTEKQKEALSYFNALARSDDLRMDWTLQPGDIQLLYNHTMLHNRTAFTDHEVQLLTLLAYNRTSSADHGVNLLTLLLYVPIMLHYRLR